MVGGCGPGKGRNTSARARVGISNKLHIETSAGRGT